MSNMIQAAITLNPNLARILACSKCNLPIPAERLEILPDTKTCVSCSTPVQKHDPNLVCAKASATGRNGFAAND